MKTLTEGTNLRLIKAMRRDKRFLWFESEFCLKSMLNVLLTGRNTRA